MAIGTAVLLIGPGASVALDTGSLTGANPASPATSAPAQPATTHRTPVHHRRAAAPAEATVQGTNPHGQGTVLAVSLGGNEAVVVGRSRGEQRSDGYHGHTTTLGLFGHDVIGNDTGPGQTAKGPLAPLQEGLLDPICSGSGGNICVEVLRADSGTTATGSTNHSRLAGLTLGGSNGAVAVAGDSNGNIQSNGDCQTAHGDTTLLKLMLGGNPLLDVGESASDSNACPSGTAVKNSANPLVAIGGQGIPLPGCGANSPGNLVDAGPLVTIACNAGSQAGAGTVGNDGIAGTALDTGNGSPAGVVTGAGTGAGAQPQAQPASAAAPSQVVLAERKTAPNKSKNQANRNGKANKRHTSSTANGKNPGAPSSAKAPSKLTAAEGSKLPYTGTDVLIVLAIAAALLAGGLALRGTEASTRRSR